MRRSLLLGLVPSLPLALLGFAGCADAPVNLGLVMLAPQGLLDRSVVDLYVFDAKLGQCLSTGHANVPKTNATQHFTIEKPGMGEKCPPGITRCTTIQLEKDNLNKVFAITAKDATGLLGEGCVVKAVNQDPLEVDIQIKRIIPPACCNDGKLGLGEQCDTGAPGGDCSGIAEDSVCAADCRSNEILLSIDDASPPNLMNGAPGTKTNLALAFGSPIVPSYPNALRAVFVNNDMADYTGGSDINMRLLAEDLVPIADPPSVGLQLTLPATCPAFTAKGILRSQKDPSIARVGDDMAVVYASDQVVNGTFDIFLAPQIPEGCVDAHPCSSDAQCATGKCDPNAGNICTTAVQLNTSTGAERPDIAEGPLGAALIVWERGGNIYGRIWYTTGMLNPASSEFLISGNAKNARVAGNLNGWAVVYDGLTPDDGDGVGIRFIDAAAKIGDAIRVNVQREGPQDQPDVAMLDDGTTLVVWRSGGDIFSQRFKPTGDPFDRDQDHPLNTTKGGQRQRPAVAASAGGLGSFFAVAWETIDDSNIGNISARFVTAAGTFGYNSVSGQNDEFVATHPDVPSGDRHFPAVAIGGAGFVAIGWQDDSTDPAHHGVFVRRFPLPPFE